MSIVRKVPWSSIKWIITIALAFFFTYCPGYASASEVVVNIPVLNVRSGPGTGHSVSGLVKMGDRLPLLEQQGDWYKVRLAGGNTGWVAGWLVDIKESPAASSTSKQVLVKTGALNVRGGPGTGNAIVDVVHKGDRLNVLAISGDWYQVMLSSGKTGWVAGWLVDVETVTSPSSGSGQTEPNSGSNTGSVSKQAVVKSSVLNVRGGPGTSNPVVARVKQGDKLLIIGSSNGWCNVELPGGGTGWVAGWLVDIKAVTLADKLPVTGEAVVYADGVNVRGGPGTEHQVVTRVSRGERMSILEKSGEWYKVQLSRGVEGWIAGWLVEVDSAFASTPEEEQEQSQPENELQKPENPNNNSGNLPEPGNKNGNGSEKETPGDGEDEVSGTGSRLTKLYVREVEERTVVTITATARMEHNIFTLTNPDRLVVDLIGIKPGDIPKEIEVSSKLVSQLRTGWFNKDPDTVRLVFDVKDAVMFTAKSGAGGKELTVEIYIPRMGDFLKDKVIAIDPGHGGHEPGAGGPTGLKEKDVNLDIALLTADLLRQNGANVVLTRSGDTFVSLEERPLIAARAGADLFISIHNNANPSSSKHGTSTYYRRDNISGTGVSQADNRLLAETIQSELLRSLGRHNLGVKQANFVVLRAATMPAVLLEISFVTNPQEEQLLKQDSYKAKAAEAITRGISNYFAHKAS